jgi:hypothetical protein
MVGLYSQFYLILVIGCVCLLQKPDTILFSKKKKLDPSTSLLINLSHIDILFCFPSMRRCNLNTTSSDDSKTRDGRALRARLRPLTTYLSIRSDSRVCVPSTLERYSYEHGLLFVFKCTPYSKTVWITTTLLRIFFYWGKFICRTWWLITCRDGTRKS